MKIINLASSSDGNCYIIDDGHAPLLIEGGIPFKTLINKLNREGYKIFNFAGCIVSHLHKDHSQAIEDIQKYILVGASLETLQMYGGTNFMTFISGVQYKFKHYVIIPFDIEHTNSDLTKCEGSLGYIIKSLKTGETVLFATDTKYIKYDLSKFKFDFVLIECNYDEDEIKEITPHLKRVINGHMNLKTCVTTLKHMDLSNCKEIFLIHLSDRHSNEDKMMSEVEKATGTVTRVCLKNGGVR